MKASFIGLLLVGTVLAVNPAAAQSFGSSNSPVADLPLNAGPGQCFTRLRIPAVIENVEQTVTVEEGYDKLSVTDPVFQPGAEQYVARDASKRYVVRQPRFEVRTEQVLVRPEYERLVVEPAQFDFVQETITVGQPRLVWRPGRNLSGIQRVDPATGQIYCLVEEPAKTETVTKRVLRTPEQVRRVVVPAQFSTVTRQVLVDPGGVEEELIPEQVSTYGTQVLVQPAGQVAAPVAPKTRTITTRVERQPERFEWAEVICDTNVTPDIISQLQGALSARGYYSGPVDGRNSTALSDALSRYQRDNNVASGGFITLETLQMLGISGSGAVLHGGQISTAPTAAFAAAAQSLSSPVVRQIAGSVREGSLARLTAPAAPSAAAPVAPPVAPIAAPASPRRPSTRTLTWSGR